MAKTTNPDNRMKNEEIPNLYKELLLQSEKSIDRVDNQYKRLIYMITIIISFSIGAGVILGIRSYIDLKNQLAEKIDNNFNTQQIRNTIQEAINYRLDPRIDSAIISVNIFLANNDSRDAFDYLRTKNREIHWNCYYPRKIFNKKFDEILKISDEYSSSNLRLLNSNKEKYKNWSYENIINEIPLINRDNKLNFIKDIEFLNSPNISEKETIKIINECLKQEKR
jgi:hypothetical protein